MLSIDHEAGRNQVPIVSLDLTLDGAQDILWTILSAPNLVGVHLGLPCGTASRARDRPISKALRAQGVPSPPPLRSAEFPFGLPHLSKHNQARVDSANVLYKLGFAVAQFCLRRDIVVSLENPRNSWLWVVFTELSRKCSEEQRRLWNTLDMVLFHACCHGSTRKKQTAWLSTKSVYKALAATCDDSHPHDPWGVRWTDSGWSFDTSQEAAYPPLLAQRAAACMVAHAVAIGWDVEPHATLHDKSSAAHGKQTKRHKPLVPEFHHVSLVVPPATLPEGAKQLPPHLGGVGSEESASEGIGSASTGEDAVIGDGSSRVKLGFYHTPKQFLSMAKTSVHPMDAADHVEAVTNKALEANWNFHPDLIRLERKKSLLQAKLMAKKLEEQEELFHANLPHCLARVLEGKRILLWEQLLLRYSYDDMAVVRFMKEGVPLVGCHDSPDCYPLKLKPASLTEEDLAQSAVWRRKAMLNRRSAELDPSHVDHLEETAGEELQAGFLEGPFESERAVTEFFGHDRWSVVRRFVLVQGSEMKLRPIDDCLESQLNAAFTATSYLKLQDVDYVAGLALKIASRLSEGSGRFGRGPWLGKCLDLSKAYKQMGIAPEHRYLAVIFFKGKQGVPRFYVANSLMFGAAAAVYAFNRVSRSIWWLFNRMLLLPCGVFYDDFPLFSPADLAASADESASALLDLLGWRHARTGPKGKPFEAVFNVLGCQLNLQGVHSGMLVLENKPSRIERMVEFITQLKAKGKVTLHEAQVLHGLLRYSCGFFAGRGLHQVCAEILAIMYPAGVRAMDLSDFCDYACAVLHASKPRKLYAVPITLPILIFTDGSYEDGVAGIGAVVVDQASGVHMAFAGFVPDQLLAQWTVEVGSQLICQVELYVMVSLRWQLKDLLCDRRSIWWVDNNAARFALIKGLSSSRTMRFLAREFYALDLSHPTFSWIERVPSFSNPADDPSRQRLERTCKMLGVSKCLDLEHPDELLQRLLA